MKASELLSRYQAGERNFQRVNLRGQSFKGQNLSGADFSEADIRSTNFAGANLRGAKFCGAKCGLQKRWVLFLMIILCLLFGLSGFIIGISGGLIGSLLGGVALFTSNSSIAFILGLITLAVLGIFFTAIIRHNLEVALGVGGASLAGTVVIAIAIAYSGDGAGIHTVNLILASSVSLAGAGCGVAIIILATALATTVMGKNTLIFTSTIPCLSALNGIEAGLRSATFPGIVAGEFSKIIAVEEILAVIGLSAYLGWHFLYREEQDTFIRWVAVMIPSLRGTSFRGANLTFANFTGAKLKSTDLRKAILTCVRWYGAKMLDRVRPGDTYLKDTQVRQWLMGKGQDKNFDRKDLRGINLQGADLQDASFIGADLSEANLQDADLSRAKLVQTPLDATDLTGATLTGAFLEDWGITSSTILKGVRCKYVYMRLPPEKRPKWLSLPVEESFDPNPRRKPDNWEEYFEGDDFADFIKPIFDTLDLYHNQGVDPRAVAISWKQLAENNPDAQLRFASMEVKGEDNLLLRLKTAPDANLSKLSAEYFETYNQLKALAEVEVQKLIAEKDKQIASLQTMVNTALKRPSFYAKNYNHQGDNEMAGEQRNIKIKGGKINASGAGAFSLGDISGTVANTINELPSSSKPNEPGIKDLLSQLQKAIDDPDLSEDDKKQTLEQLQVLAEAGKNPQDASMQKKAKKAVGFLKVIADGVEPATKLAQACAKVLPKILAFFGVF